MTIAIAKTRVTFSDYLTYFDRQKGSHAIYKNPDGKRVVIPIHSGKDIKQGTLTGML